MSHIIFSEHQQRMLELNRNVASVSDRAIQNTAKLKTEAVKEKLNGKGPVQIFTEAGFDLEMIEKNKAKSALSRWKKTYQTCGEAGFLEERRGKSSTGRPNTEQLSSEKKLEKAEARINEVIRIYQLKNMTSYLCELSDVSRSGYYAYQ